MGRLVDAVGPRIVRSFGRFSVEVDGFTLHGDGAAHMHYVRELLEERRERFFVELVTAAVPPGGAVLEAGAHLGYVTLHAARAAGPSGRVVAFEPNPGVLPLLRVNVAANGFARTVEIVALALADAPGRLPLNVTEGGDTSSLFDQGFAADRIEVGVAAADEQLRGARFDVVKLDIEGAELAALRGMRSILDRSAPGPVLFVECNPHMLAGAETTVDELVGWLEGRASASVGSTSANAASAR